MAGPVRIAILANGSQARGEIATVTTALGGLGRAAKTGLAIAGIAGITRGVIGLGASAVQLEAKFSTSFRLIAANTGAPAAEITKLSDLAIKLGADTVFSAGEAGDAMLELAKGGFKTAEIAGGGVQATMALAATEGLELADAATIVGNAMNAFGLEAKNASQIADALAAGSAASSASVASLAEGLGNVGATARQSGLSLQETVTALTVLDANAIKGAEGGTALRSFLTKLTPTSLAAKKGVAALGLEFKNADGSFRDLGNISQQLKEKLGGLGEAQRAEALNTIFGTYAKQAAAVFLSTGAKGFTKYSAAVGKSGKAQELATARMGGTAGALERLSGAADTAKLRIGQELAPTVERVANGLGDNLGPALETVISGAKELGTAIAPAVVAIADALDGLIPSADTAGSVFNDKLVPAVSTLADVVAGVVGFIDDLPGPVKEIGIEAGIAALVLPRLSAGVTAAGAAFTTASARVSQFGAAMTYSTLRAQTASAAMARLGSAARSAAGIGGLVALTQGASASDDAMGKLLTTVGGAALGFSVAGPIGAVVGSLGALAFQGKRANDKVSEAYAQIGKTDPLKVADESLKDLRSSLDQVTGAYTGATRAAVLQKLEQSGAVESATKFGISSRTLVNAALGQKNALAQLGPVIADYKAQIADVARQEQLARGAVTSDAFLSNDQRTKLADLDKQKTALQANLAELQKFPGALAQQSAAVRATAAATADYSGKLKGLPSSVKTVFNSTGVEASVDAVANLSRQYKLTPKQIRTVINATGADTSVKQVQRVIEKINAVAKAKPDLKGLKDSVASGANAAEQSANKGGLKIAASLRKGTGKAKADLGTFKQSLSGGIDQAGDTASSGGRSVGSALQEGIIAGFSGTADRLAAQARGAVNAAVAEARAAGAIQSPSKKTRYIGEMLGEGMARGLASKTTAVSSATVTLVKGALASLAALAAQSSSGVAAGNVETAVSAVTDLIADTYGRQLDQVGKILDARFDKQARRVRKSLKGKAETQALARIDKQRDTATKRAGQESKAAQTATSAGLAGQYAALRRIAGQYDAINEQLDEARRSYDDLVQQSQQYAANIRDAVVASGSVIGLGGDTGFSSIEQLISQLEGKVQTAETYSSVIQALTAAGLNQTTLQQLIDAGVEGGIGTAQAILAGGPAAIVQINTLTGKLVAAGTTLGQVTANALYGAGIQAAAGLAAGLESQAAVLQAQALAIGQNIAAGLAAGLAGQTAPKAAEKQADKVIKASKKKLKTKSPSRVFIGIGRNVTEGLAIGLDDVYVQRKASRLAGSLEKGFGTPALDAYLSGGQGGSNPFAAMPTITLTSDQTDRLRRGQDVAIDLDAYWRSGGTVGKPR